MQSSVRDNWFTLGLKKFDAKMSKPDTIRTHAAEMYTHAEAQNFTHLKYTRVHFVAVEAIFESKIKLSWKFSSYKKHVTLCECILK